MDFNELHEKVRRILNLPPEAMPEVEDAILSADSAVARAVSDAADSARYALRAWKSQLGSDVLSAAIVLDDILDAEYLSDE